MGKRMDRIASIVDEHVAVAQRTRAELLPDVEEFAVALCEALGAGHKLVVFGNGGSAADAQHFAAELTGHFATDRGPLAAIALTVDTSALTAIANDYGYADVFARQATALCAPGDVAVAMSTSGNAESVTRGVEAAKARGAVTWGFTGGSGGRLREIADHSIVVSSSATARIQEMHITIIHAVCAVIDDWVAESGGPGGVPPAR
jgi:D-sedoheptulose 7-phosphate isomerase